MKYERLTERVGRGISVKETSTNDNRSIWNAIERLAELEDKIERGELVDVKDNHLIAINRGNGKSSKQLEAIDILTMYEDGTIIIPKYPLYSIVFIVDYINEEGYSIWGGKPIARECFVTCISQIVKEEGKLLYRVQPKDLPSDVLDGEVEHCEYWERSWFEKDLFFTKAEAEQKLKELEDERD